MINSPFYLTTGINNTIEAVPNPYNFNAYNLLFIS